MSESTYPSEYDTFTTIVDGITEADADRGNLIQSALEQLQKTGGLNPQGGFATLAARLTELENIVSS